MTPLTVRWPVPERWSVVLRELGFCRVPRSASWRHNGVVFVPAESWSILEIPADAAASASASGRLGSPGLWRAIASGGGARRVFELPHRLLTDAAEDDDSSPPVAGMLGLCLNWGLQTASGGAPGDWRPPSREDLERWLPSRRRLVPAGSVVRSGEWICEPGLLALRIALVPRLRSGLNAARRQWLDLLLSCASARWRQVRLGYLANDSAVSIVAEVNFTGAPPPVVERMISVSWECLRGLTAWLADSVSLLGESSLDLEALDFAVHQTNEQRKE